MRKILLLILFPTLLIAQTSHNISSGNFYYLPSTLNINIGDTVFWINDGGFHNVNFDNNTITGSSFNNPESFTSTPTSSVDMYSHVFTIPGTYEYDCSVGSHAVNGMVGTIIVNNATLIDEHTSSRILIETYNILGKTYSYRSQGVIINRYSDGTVDKRIVVK